MHAHTHTLLFLMVCGCFSQQGDELRLTKKAAGVCEKDGLKTWEHESPINQLVTSPPPATPPLALRQCARNKGTGRREQMRTKKETKSPQLFSNQNAKLIILISTRPNWSGLPVKTSLKCSWLGWLVLAVLLLVRGNLRFSLIMGHSFLLQQNPRSSN